MGMCCLLCVLDFLIVAWRTLMMLVLRVPAGVWGLGCMQKMSGPFVHKRTVQRREEERGKGAK
jgi:hypothetical protein